MSTQRVRSVERCHQAGGTVVACCSAQPQPDKARTATFTSSVLDGTVLSWYNTISYYRILPVPTYLLTYGMSNFFFLLRQIFCTEYHVMIMPSPTSGLTH